MVVMISLMRINKGVYKINSGYIDHNVLKRRTFASYYWSIIFSNIVLRNSDISCDINVLQGNK